MIRYSCDKCKTLINTSDRYILRTKEFNLFLFKHKVTGSLMVCLIPLIQDLCKNCTLDHTQYLDKTLIENFEMVKDFDSTYYYNLYSKLKHFSEEMR